MQGKMKTAPMRKMIANQPHQLSYITPREAQILKMLGGAGTSTKEGIPAYWNLFEPSTWGDGKGFEGFTSNSNEDASPAPAPSNNSNESSYVSEPKTFGDHYNNIKNDLSIGFGLSDANDATRAEYDQRTADNIAGQQERNKEALGNDYTGNLAYDNMTLNARNDDDDRQTVSPASETSSDTSSTSSSTEDAARQGVLDSFVEQAGTYNASVDEFNKIFQDADDAIGQQKMIGVDYIGPRLSSDPVIYLPSIRDTIPSANIGDLYDDPTTSFLNENFYDQYYGDLDTQFQNLSSIQMPDAPDFTTDYNFTDDEKALFALNEAEDYSGLLEEVSGLRSTLGGLKTSRDAEESAINEFVRSGYNTLDDATYMLDDYTNPDGTYDYRGAGYADTAANTLRLLDRQTRNFDEDVLSQLGLGDYTTLNDAVNPAISGIRSARDAEQGRIDTEQQGLYDYVDTLLGDDSLAGYDMTSGDALDALKREIDQKQRAAGRFDSDLNFNFADPLAELQTQEDILDSYITQRDAERGRIDNFRDLIDEYAFDYGQTAAGFDISDKTGIDNLQRQIDSLRQRAGNFESDLDFNFDDALGSTSDLAGVESTLSQLLTDRGIEERRISDYADGISQLENEYRSILEGDPEDYEQKTYNTIDYFGKEYVDPYNFITTTNPFKRSQDVKYLRDELGLMGAGVNTNSNYTPSQAERKQALLEDFIKARNDGSLTAPETRERRDALTIADLDQMQNLRKQIDDAQLGASRFESLLSTDDFNFPLEDLAALEGDVNQLFSDRTDELDRISRAEENFANLADLTERSANNANRFSKAALDAIQNQITTGQRDISDFSSLLPYNFGEAGTDATAVQDYIDAQAALDSAVSARSSELDAISGDISGALRDFDATELYEEDKFNQMLDDLGSAGIDLASYSGGRVTDLLGDLATNKKSVNDQLDALYAKRGEFEGDAATMLENLTGSDYSRANYDEYSGLIDTLSDDIDLYGATQADDERRALRSELARRLGLVEADELAVQERLDRESSDYGFSDFSLYEPEEDVGFYNFGDDEEEEEEEFASLFATNTRAA